jgi:hypothetical protein
MRKWFHDKSEAKMAEMSSHSYIFNPKGKIENKICHKLLVVSQQLGVGAGTRASRRGRGRRGRDFALLIEMEHVSSSDGTPPADAKSDPKSDARAQILLEIYSQIEYNIDPSLCRAHCHCRQGRAIIPCGLYPCFYSDAWSQAIQFQQGMICCLARLDMIDD